MVAMMEEAHVTFLSLMKEFRMIIAYQGREVECGVLQRQITKQISFMHTALKQVNILFLMNYTASNDVVVKQRHFQESSHIII